MENGTIVLGQVLGNFESVIKSLTALGLEPLLGGEGDLSIVSVNLPEGWAISEPLETKMGNDPCTVQQITNHKQTPVIEILTYTTPPPEHRFRLLI